MKYSILAAALMAVALPLAAQTSSVQGTVTDTQGAAVPEAIVTVVNIDTAASRSAITGQGGAYSFLQLPPGPYKIDVKRPGFRSASVQARLQINTPATVNVQLEIGQVTETVNVEADATTINTQNASVGNPFTETQIKQLPLLTRNVVELLSLQPGVAPGGQVLGAKRDQNNVTLDGVDINDNQSSEGFNAALTVPLDSVQEFRTTVAGQGADQGRSSGGQVSLVTKSGSNQYHGSVYEFHRNVKTAANNWFSNRAGIKRENLIRNQYGAALGGKIVKDRAFFFTNWEDRKDRTASAVNRTVPTASFKQGIVKFRMSNGAIGELTPGDVRSVDPLSVGASAYMVNLMSQYPAGNDDQASADRGLNFSVFRFNAPRTLNNRSYVAKMDFNLDQAAKHTLSLRGTLADNAQDETLAQFPGQDAASKSYDTSRGLSARYTTVLSPTLINVFNYGLTRISSGQTGADGFLPSFTIATPNAFPRALNRKAPTHNFVNDLTWMKGRHTVQGGVNIRMITNERDSFSSSFPSYSFSRNTLRGLGADINDQVNAFARTKYGNSSLRATEATQLTNAMGTLMGVINQYSVTYNFGKDGTAIPIGEGLLRKFSTSEYEFYIQDTFKWRRDLTVTYGVRYGLYEVPYESNGVQVVTQVPLDQYFADRNGAGNLGIPGSAVPTAQLVYDLAGAANGKPGWYSRDKNNWAPRASIAWAPEGDGFLTRLFGRGSVLRAGGAVMYDRYGSNMVVNFASSGSPGLATTVTQPANTDFSTSFRYNGSSLPALPAAPAGGMPFTPPTIIGGFTSFTGVSPDLRAPYSYVLSASYTRPVVSGITVEVGYIGRLTRKGLLQQDISQPLTNFKDPKSGMTWTQASGILRDHYESGITPAQVRANPNLIPAVAYFENMFPGARNKTFTGSATANYFNTVYGTYASSDLDALNDMDRERQANGQCISVFGCNTFFALQSAGMRSWVNASNASYHGGQLVVRRGVQNGWGFDFNYTLSHSLDIASGAESGGTGETSVIQDSFNPRASYGPSSFDIRHNITTNAVVELPFGKGKPFLRDANTLVDSIAGGWQLSMLTRYRSGLPVDISNGGVYPTNYLNAAIAILRPNATMPETGVGYNQNGAPSIFRTTSSVNSFMGQYPGTVGTRGIIRGAGLLNFDLSAAKSFRMPFEGHRLQFRAEAFNAFNNVNFSSLSISLNTPGTFGQFTAANDARVMQFGLRYEF